MGREENVLIFQDTERLSKTNGKLNPDLKASASGQKLILETDALKTCKSTLNLVGECRSLSYDVLTAHVAIVFTRYMLLALEQRKR